MSDALSPVEATCSGVFCGDRTFLITDLADTEHALARDLAAYRELLHVALTLLHERGAELGRLRRYNRQLRDECRRLRQAGPHRDEPRATA